MQLWITRGFPRSGKTTFAKLWVANERSKRSMVCRDDIRPMLGATMQRGDQVLDEDGEYDVTAVEIAIVTALLRRGRSVMVHDMNLSEESVWLWDDIARELDVPCAVVDLRSVPIEERLRRDAAEEAAGRRSLGRDVMIEIEERQCPTYANRTPQDDA